MKKLFTALLAGAMFASTAMAAKPDDGMVFKAAAALKGKRIAYVPMSMGVDLTQAWLSGLNKDAQTYGYEILVRDPNWNVDAGAQALTQLIQEKPDVIVLHPPEIQVYSRLIQRAERAGIPVVIINLKTSNNTDAFVGADWYAIGELQTRAMQKLCGKQQGATGKIAIMQGVPTNPSGKYGVDAVNDMVAASGGDLEIVSNQSADWEAGKAKAIATTVLQANPDLCGYIGMWEAMDIGIAAAIREAGKQDQVKLVTQGGGNQNSGCDNIVNGRFSAYVSYEAQAQARDLMMVVRALLQNPPAKPGSNPIALYTPLKVLDKENLRPGSCWNLELLKAEGP